MQINRCPKCGQEPAIAKIVDYINNKFGYEVGCYDCEIQTEVIKTRDEAVAKWNELTEKIKNETTKEKSRRNGNRIPGKGGAVQ